MPRATWRQIAAMVIEKALESGRKEGLDGDELERHVKEAYPFGARKWYPYKVWLEEFNRALRGRRLHLVRGKLKPRRVEDLPGQQRLFT